MRVGLRLLSIGASVTALVLGLAVTTGFERTPAPNVSAQELTLAVDEPPPAIAAVDTNGVRAAPGRLLTRVDSLAGFLPVAALLAMAFLARRKPDLRLALARVDRARARHPARHLGAVESARHPQLGPSTPKSRGLAVST